MRPEKKSRTWYDGLTETCGLSKMSAAESRTKQVPGTEAGRVAG